MRGAVWKGLSWWWAQAGVRRGEARGRYWLVLLQRESQLAHLGFNFTPHPPPLPHAHVQGPHPPPHPPLLPQAPSARSSYPSPL